MSENFNEYHHDKLVLTNQIGIQEEEELVGHIIDGNFDERLCDRTRLRCFEIWERWLVV